MGTAVILAVCLLLLAQQWELSSASNVDINRTYSIVSRYSGEELRTPCYYCSFYNHIDYAACSMANSTNGWNRGTRYFPDPVDPGFMVTSISTDLQGSFNCFPGQLNIAHLKFVFAGETSREFSGPAGTENSNCYCPNCVTSLNIPSSALSVHTNGWPGYKYGGNNTIQVIVESHGSQDICLSIVNVTLNATRVFPTIQSASPNLASISSSSVITITADYINPTQNYHCFFNGALPGVEARILNSTTAVCDSPIIPNLSNFRQDLINTLVLAPQWADPTAQYNQPTAFAFYAEPTITSATPNHGKAGDHISVIGQGFIDTSYMSCKFGDEVVNAVYSTDYALECTVPLGFANKKASVSLTVSLNGQDTSTSAVKFQVDSSSNWWTTKRIAIILGSIAGAVLLLGIIISVVIYQRKQIPENSSLLRSRSNGYRTLPSLSLNSVPTDTSLGVEMNEVNIIEKIGRGSFGDIYKAEWRGTEVAIKKIPFNSLNEELVEEMLNEARIMASIRHPNVLSLMGCCPKPPEVCIVMEYMPRGSLYQILQDSRVPLSWQLIQRMALDAARGMNFLHQHNPIIMHRDLKSHNLLVDDAWRVKVADFGLSRMIEEKVSATMTVCGTPCWTAPEVLRNQRYSVKADVYSFGICLWELYTRSAPYAGMTPFQVMFGVASGGMRPPINDDCPPDWQDLMVTCWSENPDDRPTFDEIARRLQLISLPETGGFH